MARIDGTNGDDILNGTVENDEIYGGDGNDSIAGAEGDDYLEGNGGNDVLDGGAGSDGMVGGAGDDVYVVDQAWSETQNGDWVYENPDEGTDEVQTSVDFGLAEDFENLTALGSGNLYLGGNGLDNVITGNSGDNYTSGGGGNDSIDGGDGRDVAAFHLPAGTTGSLRTVEGPDDTVLIQLVQEDGSFEDVFSISISGTGSATVTGLGIAAGEGSDTVANVEELHFFVDNWPEPTPDNQFAFVQLAMSPPPLQDNFAHVSGSAAGDTIDLEALYPDAGPDANINANGGFGDDTILGTSGWNYIRGDEGDDTIDGRGGGDSVAFGLPAGMTGTLRVAQGTGDYSGSLIVERVDGDTIEWLFIVSFGEDGTATVQGVNSAAFLGTDTVSNVGALDFVVDNPEFDPNQFTHIIIPSGSEAPEALYGSDDSDFVRAAGGNDALYGFGGDDILRGGDGNDFLRGGGGNDVIDGGAGHDRASFYDSPTGVHVDLNLQGQEQDTGAGFDTLIGIETVSGTVNDDTLIGDDGANSLWGSGGNDVLTGNGGDDYLGVTGGDHVLDGGDGSDTVAFINEDLDAPGPVTIDLNLTDAQWTGIGTWTIANVENLSGGNFDDQLTGNDSDNILAGAPGDDLLAGGAGNDLLLGDGYIGVDTSDPSRSYFIIEDGAEYGAVGNDTLVGGGGDDVIYGGGGNDTIRGGDGADLIYGGDGDDFINTGFGNDVAYGGDGYDVIYLVTDVSSTSTVEVTGSGGDVTVTQDGILTNQAYEGEEILVWLGGSGGSVLLDATGYVGQPGTFLWLVDHDGTDVVFGSAGSEGFANTWANVTGNDVFTGNGGADVYDYTWAVAGMNGDTITDFDFDDTIDLRFNGSGELWGNGGYLADHFIGNAAFNGVAGEYRYATLDGNTFVEADTDGDTIADQVLTLSNGEYALFETSAGSNVLVRSNVLTGTEDGDVIDGGDLPDMIYGLGGDDVLRGGLGNDQLYGGDGHDLLSEASGDAGPFGSDLYDGGDGSDRVSYFTSDGLNGVTVNLNMTTAQNTGQGSDTLIGIENVTSTYDSDTLIGNGAANWFWTFSGYDFVLGNGGDDYFTVGADDKVIDGGSGIDTVEIADFSYAQVYQNAGGITVSLELQGSAQWVGTGWWTLSNVENLGGFTGDDQLTGDSNDNVLAGQLGNDRLVGGAGNDSLYGDGTWIFANGVQTLVAEDTADGPGGNDRLIAGDGDDYAFGGGGNDRIDGGNGDDTLDGGTGDDILFTGFGTNLAIGGDGFDIVLAQLDNSLSDTVYVTGTGGDVTISQGGTVTNRVLGAEEVQVWTYGPTEPLVLDASGYTATADTVLWLVDHDGTDIMIGSAGNDYFGNVATNVTGNDVFTGFGGYDLFDYTYAVGAMNGDTITDFEFDETIDLRFNDAANLQYNGGLLLDTFIGNNAFSGTAGEYRYSAHDGQTFVEADTDGDAIADQVLTLSNGEFDLVETYAGSNILRMAAAGVAVDGLLSGATVFMDTNGDGQWNEGEAITTTDANGRYTFESPAVGTLIVTGGINSDTGLPNQVTLTAPLGSGVVNPLTTLVQAVLASSPEGTTAQSAAASVAAALGIDPGIDLLNTDVFSAAAAGDPLALEAQKLAATIVTVLVAAADASGEESAGVVLSNLASAVLESGDTGQVDLTDPSTMETILDGTVPDEQLQSISDGLASAAQDIADSTSLEELSDSQADALTRGNDLDNVLIGGSLDDDLIGFGGSDQLSGGGGNDSLDGGLGADTLIGGLGADILTGGSGADLFVFTSAADSAPSAADFITDFSGHWTYQTSRNGKPERVKGDGDMIDLSAIDGNALVDGDQAFTLSKKFTGSAGQAYSSYDSQSDVTSIFMDVDGDAVADMTIRLAGQANLIGADFIL